MVDMVPAAAVLAGSLLVGPTYVLLMAAVLRICGVSREETAKWALDQAGRHRIVDLIHAIRGIQESVIDSDDPRATAPTDAERAVAPRRAKPRSL